ncbi:MAG: homoserine dehydrogenase [Gracilibacteraceae bacterium]|jgi:homoserine dehydrogenase|nr:homoserine dehydrogenase [Gracilibacteraceae bacterium]
MINQNINIGLLGFGTVGGGVAAVLAKNAAAINARAGCNLRIKAALVRDLSKNREAAGTPLTTAAADILRDDDVHIVAELMGGVEPARTYVLEALRRKKSVVTANKDLLALHAEEIFRVAEENGQDVYFEGAVAGGIPIIAAIRASLTANDISSVMGIINGTTNYILTAMTEQGREFAAVLREAQELGYAESDPTADVAGLDAARKLAILATLAFHTQVSLTDVYVEGITDITASDISYARELGCVIKLLAIARKTDEGVEARVHPALLPERHPLATVRDVFNAVYVVGDALGESMFYGRGAGALPTASAVLSDIIQVARNRNTGGQGRLGLDADQRLPVKPARDYRSSYYIRLKVKDEPRVFASLASFFAEADISFASIIQKPRRGGAAEIVLMTHPCRESQLEQALTSMRAYSKLDKIYNKIRVLHD